MKKLTLLFLSTLMLTAVNLQADASAETTTTPDAPVTADESKADDSKQIEDNKNEDKQIEDANTFIEDRISVEIMSGSLFSTNAIGPDINTFDYAPLNARIGWMLNTPEGEGFFRGNWEALLELSTSFIYDGPGSVLVGPTALVRYNFVQPGWKVVPYVQVGAGIVYTDAYQDDSQNAIGQAIEFTPQASIGLKYLIDNNWSLNLEGMFHHVSNAGMANRNLGVNSLGALVGVSYYFDKTWNE